MGADAPVIRPLVADREPSKLLRFHPIDGALSRLHPNDLDAEHDFLFVERVLRVNFAACDLLSTATSASAASAGAPKHHRPGWTFDHFFPSLLKQRGEMPDADGIWNLVLACARCNRDEGGKFV